MAYLGMAELATAVVWRSVRVLLLERKSGQEPPVEFE